MNYFSVFTCSTILFLMLNYSNIFPYSYHAKIKSLKSQIVLRSNPTIDRRIYNSDSIKSSEENEEQTLSSSSIRNIQILDSDILPQPKAFSAECQNEAKEESLVNDPNARGGCLNPGQGVKPESLKSGFPAMSNIQ